MDVVAAPPRDGRRIVGGGIGQHLMGTMAFGRHAGDLLRFSVVGGIGFIVDAGMLTVLVNGLQAGPYAGRVASFLCAVTVTWGLHRVWTFRGRSARGRRAEFTLWLLTQSLGVAVNFGVYALCLEVSATARAWPALAVAAGSAVALAVNFVLAKAVVFRRPPVAD